MCTLSYVPISSSSYIFTSNRDERKSRTSAFAPTIHKENGVKFLAPIDGEALGTWLGATEQGRVVCLLNGEFEIHIPTPPYKHSRGKVVMDALTAPIISDYLENYDFDNIEPFTLIVVENRGTIELLQFVWDGSEKHFSRLDSNVPHIWSSSTLYTPQQKEKRTAKFMLWLNEKSRLPKEILQVHEAINAGGKLGLSMLRPQYCTVSCTQLEVDAMSVNMFYHDRLTQEKDQLKLPFTIINYESQTGL
ncbi:NRDE family protein [Flammeovirga sp. EKP202]|uniref:NRDE family protein n=1 Tax=Flammeovirga sp. EKP202 TaxID=2770592 RepID=UPI00165FA13A|nr:NRDE family protein [Flammeovirga sp. EKP202]MBD0399834.1 NRDE family protein [Flammeovirga sp. EKP202]